MVRFYLGTEEAAQELLEGRLRRVAFALHRREAVAVRAAVLEAELSMMRRVGASEEALLVARGNLGNTYDTLGRNEEALSTYREAYAGCKSLLGGCNFRTLMAANNLVYALQKQMKHAEALSILREPLSDARRALGDDHEMTLMLSSLLSDSLLKARTSPTVDDIREAIAIREDVCKRSRRLLGGAHPDTRRRQDALDCSRRNLARLFPDLKL